MGCFEACPSKGDITLQRCRVGRDTRITSELKAECFFVALARYHGYSNAWEMVIQHANEKAIASRIQCPKWPLFFLFKAQRKLSSENVGKLIKNA